MLIGAFFNRRARRRIVAEWSERHAQAVEQLRMRDELQLAREMQLSMLPEAPPALPWLDVAAVSIPATEVGGDYYDYFHVGERLALVCGDVAGHGLASGIVLTALRSGFTLLRDSLADPAAVLMRLHDLVVQTSRRRMLATAAVVVIDPLTRRARIASAGHPPVMFRSNGSTAVRPIELFGPPLGVRLPVHIAQTEIAVAPGDIFVLHSDGIYETVNEAGEPFGLDRLAAVIAGSNGRASNFLAAIVDEVTAFRGPAAQEDDLTVVVAIVQ
jgi:sigma-B regulation protein RsbU (phosphoserine phosphatase)